MLAICCDPCKCQTCDRHANGMKTLLKATQTGVNTSPAQPPISRRMSTPKTAIDSETSSPNTNRWYTYINGGAAVEDATVLENLQAQEAELLTRLRRNPIPQTEVSPCAQQNLIDVSDCSGPVQPLQKNVTSKQNLSSTKPDWLIDLDSNIGEARHTKQCDNNAPAKRKVKGKAKAAHVYNLLD